MTAIFADEALLPTGWTGRVRITMEGGVIRSVEANSSAQAQDERHAILVPAMPNLHSHAFQRGMAGLAERRGSDTDNFTISTMTGTVSPMPIWRKWPSVSPRLPRRPESA